MKRALLPMATLLTFVLVLSAGQAWAQFTEGKFVSFTLEGCRNDGSITLPNGGGQFICLDTAYTTGNLGKGWNELDLVPHRLTSSLGSQSNATTDYNVYVAGDYMTGGKIGWDVISVPVVNAAKSDASCSVTGGGTSYQGDANNPFGGGTDTVIYRLLTIHQNKGTTCVFDYYQRLALGSHLYPGSSLQSYLFTQIGLSGSKKTISIPVPEITPQSISKDMSATQGSDHTWSVSKSPSPATVSFADTCNVANSTSTGIQITVSWTKLAAVPGGPVTVVTHVYATNPAARSITVNVTDVIYSGTTPLDTSGPTSTAVPANTTNFLVLTHTTTVPSGTTDLNDVATATYTDTVTGVPIPGSTQATASAAVQLSGPELNNTATINDSESMTGTGFEFSADSFLPAVGAFDSPYIAGTKTVGPVGWTSNSQTGSGSVTFDKTIYTSAGNANSGSLSDTATLNGVDGFTTSANASVNVSAHAKVTLTIHKSLNVGLPFSSQTFTFHVKDAQNNEVTGSPTTITLTSGQSSGNVSIGNLEPGTYTVSEDAVAGYTSDSPQQATISLPSCSGSVTIHNTLQGSDLTVSKTATPSFTRTYTWGITKAVDHTSSSLPFPGNDTFNYTVIASQLSRADSAWTVTGNITVTNPNPWAITGVNVSDAVDNGGTCAVTGGTNVSVAANSNVVLAYSCSYAAAPSASSGTNTGTATWDKTAALTPNGSATGTANFAFTTPTTTVHKTITVTDTFGGNTTTLGTVTGTDAPDPLASATYTYSRTLPVPQSGCVQYPNTATIVETGATASQNVQLCALPGYVKVIKTYQGAPITGSLTFTFQLRQGASVSSDGTVLESLVANSINGGVLNFTSQLIGATTYQICETGIQPGWTTSLSGFVPNSLNNPNVDNSTVCANFQAISGSTVTVSVDNAPPPEGLALTIGYWKNWASCAKSSSKKNPTLDQTLYAAMHDTSNPEYNGIVIGVIPALRGDYPNAGSDCPIAVSILNKSTRSGKKAASNPLYNMAAQLLAAKLNLAAGAYSCPKVTTTIAAAQALLVKYNFNDITLPKVSAADATLANGYATILDNYNNDLPSACQ